MTKFSDFTVNDYNGIFAVSLNHLLEDDEGVIVNYKNDHFIVWKCSTDNTIKIEPATIEDLLPDQSIKEFESGQMIWMHDRLMEN